MEVVGLSEPVPADGAAGGEAGQAVGGSAQGAWILVAWGPDRVFGLASSGVPGLPAQAVRDGDDLFTRASPDEGWAQWDLAEYIAAEPRAADLLLLDVADALERGDLREQDEVHLVVDSDVRAGPWNQDVVLEVEHDTGRVTEVRSMPDGRLSGGFVLRPSDGFPFAPVRPLP